MCSEIVVNDQGLFEAVRKSEGNEKEKPPYDCCYAIEASPKAQWSKVMQAAAKQAISILSKKA